MLPYIKNISQWAMLKAKAEEGVLKRRSIKRKYQQETRVEWQMNRQLKDRREKPKTKILIQDLIWEKKVRERNPKIKDHEDNWKEMRGVKHDVPGRSENVISFLSNYCRVGNIVELH